MRRSGYGQRGGLGPTAGKRARFWVAIDPATGKCAADPVTGRLYRARTFFDLADPVVTVYDRSREGKPPYVTAGERAGRANGTREPGPGAPSHVGPFTVFPAVAEENRPA